MNILNEHSDAHERLAEAGKSKLDNIVITLIRRYWKERSFAVEYLPLAIVALLGMIACHTVAGVLTYSFWMEFTQHWVPEQYSFFINIVFIAFLQGATIFTFGRFWKSVFMSNQSFSFIMLVGSLVFIALGAYMEYNGGKATVKLHHEAPALEDEKVILAYYDDQINKLDNQIAYWQDKADKTNANWNILNETLPALQQETNALRSRRDEAARQVQERNRMNISENEREVEFTATSMAKIGVGVTLVSFLLMGWLSHYAWKAAKDYEIRSSIGTKLLTNSPLSQAINLCNPPSVSPALPAARKVGFEIQAKPTTPAANEAQVKEWIRKLQREKSNLVSGNGNRESVERRIQKLYKQIEAANPGKVAPALAYKYKTLKTEIENIKTQ